MTKTRLFISHISKETELAQALKRHLARDFLGLLDVFVSSDRKSILAGSRWLDEVASALKAAEVEIVLCSAESVTRPWVNFEAGAGWIRDILVIPVCHSGMTPAALPVPLNMLQAVEAGRREGLEELYAAIARKLNTDVPSADFGLIADEIRKLEAGYRQTAHSLKRIEDPRILCAATEQYELLDFEKDVDVLNEAFPGKVTVERALTGARLRKLLTTQQFDILHLVLAVDYESGDLIFSPVDPVTHHPTTSDPDKMAPAAFAEFVGESNARLVVMATCRAVPLGVEIADTVNMVTADVELSGADAAAWAAQFYDLLREGCPLYRAADIMKRESNVARFRLIRHQDIAFAPAKPGRG